MLMIHIYRSTKIRLSTVFSLCAFFCLSQGWLHAEEINSHAVVSAHPFATQAGIEILEQGGNAFDAAVAVSAMLAVVEPYSSGIGGGGFWLLKSALSGETVVVDGRETAPLSARSDLYVKDSGRVAHKKSVTGALAAAIPGVPAALAHISTKYGVLSLQEALAPAIARAEEGFPVDKRMIKRLTMRQVDIRANKALAGVFLDDGNIPELGMIIRQPDFAHSLRLLAKKGRDGFYNGELAQKLVDGVRQGGGIWSMQDLEAYEIIERKPITFQYRNARITTVPPPSAGGVILAQTLQILEGYAPEELSSTNRVHVRIEAMKRAYRDRYVYLGDPAFVEMPLQRLLSRSYADKLRQSIRLDRTTPSTELGSKREPIKNNEKNHGQKAMPATEGNDTTHYSIMDAEGNRVSATLSVNYSFGAAFMAPGTGIVLNDEMDDFVALPDVPNLYGLSGSEANTIAPGKRMLSSMSPTMVETEDAVALVGTPGGSRITTMVLLAVLGIVDEGKHAEALVSAPRYHHQYLPDIIQYEAEAFDQACAQALSALGHQLRKQPAAYGNMQVILWYPKQGRLEAASDPRGIGQAIVKPVTVDRQDKTPSLVDQAA